MAHPAYDANWQGQAVDPMLAARPSNVPTLWTQGLWDQEDMWGANHAWRALKAAGHEANNWLVLGPWNHIQVTARRHLARADEMGGEHVAAIIGAISCCPSSTSISGTDRAPNCPA